MLSTGKTEMFSSDCDGDISELSLHPTEGAGHTLYEMFYIT